LLKFKYLHISGIAPRGVYALVFAGLLNFAGCAGWPGTCFGLTVKNPEKPSDTVRSVKLNNRYTILGNNSRVISSKGETGDERMKFLDDFAVKAPSRWEKSLKMLADSLTKPAGNDLEKARVLFTWVATHIKYNTKAGLGNVYREMSTRELLRVKQGLCGDFSRLLSDLCLAAGVEARRISGYTKGFRYRQHLQSLPSRHAWNVIRTDGRWLLTDVTWAAGLLTGSGGNITSIPRFESFWFDVDPRAFIFTHYPDSNKWQSLGSASVTYNNFLKLPCLGGEFFKAGFDAGQVFPMAVSMKNDGFVLVYNQQHPLHVVKAPVSRSVKRGSRVNFIIRSGFAESIVLWDDRRANFFANDRNTFSLDWVPTGSTIRVSVKNKDSGTYKRLLEYEVKP
jgi:hypothetical protein